MSDHSLFVLAFGMRRMTTRPATKPRKDASQDRSRATVDALIEATARILVREGFDKASTNRIAEKAGVSVGSLYQYFPCKEALVVVVLVCFFCVLLLVARWLFVVVVFVS